MSSIESSDPDRERRVDEAIADYLKLKSAGQTPDRAMWLEQLPDLKQELAEFLDDSSRLGAALMDPDQTLDSAPQRAAPRGAFVATESSAAAELSHRVHYFGDYELLNEIARGGMGVVYKARQVNLNRVVALKMILSGQFAGNEAIRRFHAEAEAVAKRVPSPADSLNHISQIASAPCQLVWHEPSFIS